jgi:hypothetical protein
MAMKTKGEIFDSLDKAITQACVGMNISKNEWTSNSAIINSIRQQRRISEYIH